jgi:hypothetical protein
MARGERSQPANVTLGQRRWHRQQVATGAAAQFQDSASRNRPRLEAKEVPRRRHGWLA